MHSHLLTDVLNSETLLCVQHGERQAWSLKERAMKCRMIRNCERLDEHTRSLTPLHIGDQVLIQNQGGPHPTKWDKSGMIVDVKSYDQYLVKVDGSGRLTTRNRRFLRTFLPASLTVSSNPQQRSIVPHIRQPCDTVPLTSPISPPSQTTPVSIPEDLTAKLFLDSCPFDKCFISIHFVLCIVFAYVAGGGMYIHVYIL